MVILADTAFQAFLSAATAVRCTAPCSISTCYTTAAITHYKPPSVLAPAKSVIEDEVRRNTFWIGEYMRIDRGAWLMYPQRTLWNDSRAQVTAGP